MSSAWRVRTSATGIVSTIMHVKCCRKGGFRLAGNSSKEVPTAIMWESMLPTDWPKGILGGAVIAADVAMPNAPLLTCPRVFASMCSLVLSMVEDKL